MRNNGKWTEARFRSFIKGALRRTSIRWPPRYSVLEDALVGRMENEKTGRLAKHYKCAGCEGVFPLKDTAIDHIDPVVDPEKGFTTWDEVVERMFCEADGLQVLCNTCHKKKSKEEREVAKTRNRK